jgi:hypothetical protein
MNMAALAQTNLTSAAITNGLRDIKPPVEIPSGWEWLWWVLGALVCVALLVGLVVSLLTRRKALRTPPLIPPHIRARERLDDALKLLSQPKPFVIAVSDTLRGYLDSAFALRNERRKNFCTNCKPRRCWTRRRRRAWANSSSVAIS